MKLADVFRVAKTVKMSDAQRFAQHVVPEVVRPARVIWNQAIGALFALFAVFFFGCAFQYYQEKPAGAYGFIFLGLVMSYFVITSFLQARRIARPRAPGGK